MGALSEDVPLPIGIGLFKGEDMGGCDIAYIDGSECYVWDAWHIVGQDSLHEDTGGRVVIVEGGA